jgi:hypothetical protein
MRHDRTFFAFFGNRKVWLLYPRQQRWFRRTSMIVLVPAIVVIVLVFQDQPLIMWTSTIAFCLSYVAVTTVLTRRIGRRVDLGRIRRSGRS